MVVNCDFHPEEEAIVVCVTCHKPLCETCRIKVNERNYCSECATEAKSQDINSEIKDLSNFPQDVVKAAARADDYLKEKGVHEEVGRLKTKSSEKLKSFSTAIRDSTQSGIKNVKMSSNNPLDEIKKAKELLDMGAISQDEFKEIKKKYLEKM